MARNRGWFGKRSDPQIGERPRHETRADDSKWSVEDTLVAKDIEAQLAKEEPDWSGAEQRHAERAARYQSSDADASGDSDNRELYCNLGKVRNPPKDADASEDSDDADSDVDDDADEDAD